MMRTQEQPVFAAPMALPAFQERCDELARVIALLDLSPLHSIASSAFVSRFAVLREAIESFFTYEEELLILYSIPLDNRRSHLADHRTIREMLHNIGRGAAERRNRTAIEVYEAIRFQIDQHVLNFSLDLGRYVPARTH